MFEASGFIAAQLCKQVKGKYYSVGVSTENFAQYIIKVSHE